MTNALRSSAIRYLPHAGPRSALADRVAKAANVLQVLEETAQSFGHKTLDFGAGRVLTICGLLDLALGCGHTLLEQELPEHAVIAIALPTAPEVMPVFFGAMYAHMIPTILPSPGLASREEFTERVRQVVKDAGVRAIVTTAAWRGRVQAALNHDCPHVTVFEPEQLIAPGAGRVLSHPRTDDIAFLQYSSGSTARPKGIALTHANVVAGIAAILEGGDNSPDDIAMQWLPLYHDMGLLGLLTGISSGAAHYLCEPTAPFRDPTGWLRMMSRLRVTYFGGPCTALGYLADNVDERTLEEIDLSSIRVICIGSEPIDPQVVERFERRFAGVGLKPNRICPAYGMAEATLAITAHRLGRPMRVDFVDRNCLGVERRVQRTAADDSRARAVVGVGVPVRGVELRVVAPNGEVLPEDCEGEVQVRGPAVMQSYLNRSRSESHDGPWFRTGDLGYVADGQLFLTGRLKQIVIVNGVNYHAEDCEWALADLPQIFRGRCAALDMGGGDQLTIIVETRHETAAERLKLANAVRNRIRGRLGLQQIRVGLARPKTIPHTTSGKPRRLVLRDMLMGHLRPTAVEYFDEQFSPATEAHR